MRVSKFCQDIISSSLVGVEVQPSMLDLDCGSFPGCQGRQHHITAVTVAVLSFEIVLPIFCSVTWNYMMATPVAPADARTSGPQGT